MITAAPSRKEPQSERVARFWQRCRRAAIDALFPPRCLLCGDWDCGGDSSLCAPCALRIDQEREAAACPVCATDLAPFSMQDGRCPECKDESHAVAGIVRVSRWRPIGGELSAVGTLLRDYKYRGRRELGPAIAGWLAEAVRRAEWLPRIEAVVPVPTHWTRRLRRPFYAADELAELLGRERKLPAIPVLRRVRGGKRQIGLSYTDRKQNIRGAFAIRSGFAMRRSRVLLVDDVRTTGATLGECARVLRMAGAAEVYAAVVVRAGWRHLVGQRILGV